MVPQINVAVQREAHLLRGASKSVLMVQMVPLLATTPNAASKESISFTMGRGAGLLLLRSKKLIVMIRSLCLQQASQQHCPAGLTAALSWERSAYNFW